MSAAIQEGIDKRSCPEPNSGCVLWFGATNKRGYGYIRIGNSIARAHRVAYELKYGPIPDGLVLDHLCRVKCCINTDHLEAVTQKVNVQRGVRKARRAT